MIRKILSICVVFAMVFSTFAFAAPMGNENLAQYEAQKKKINDQIISADRAQIAKMKAMQADFKTKITKMKSDGSTKAERKAFHQKYKASVKEAKAQYKEQIEALRKQLNAIKATQKQARADAKAAKKSMKGKK